MVNKKAQPRVSIKNYTITVKFSHQDSNNCRDYYTVCIDNPYYRINTLLVRIRFNVGIVAWHTVCQSKGYQEPDKHLPAGLMVRVIGNRNKIIFKEQIGSNGTAKKAYPFSWEIK